LLGFLLLAICMTAGVAQADNSVTFGFDALTLSNGTSNCTAGVVNSNCSANNATVQSYMTTTLNGAPGAGKSVVLTGAEGTNSWNGENHVILSTGTLAGSTGKTFVVNNNGRLNGPAASDPGSNDFMVFSGMQVTSVKFMLEIFPDANCASTGTCTEVGDFELWAGTSSLSNIHTWTSKDPTNGNTTCQASAGSSCETAYQLAPQWSTDTGNATGVWALSNVSTLDFIDWPPTIGIQNLIVTYTTPGGQQGTPEPNSLLLLGMGLSGLAALRYRQSKSRS